MMKLKISKLSIISIISLCVIQFESSAYEYVIGADLSYVKQQEDKGFQFKDDGLVKPCMEIFSDHGYNWVRLRLFHSPDPSVLPNNLEYTIASAKQAKEHGMKLLLNFHYSDYWADPQRQNIPKDWEGFSPEELANAVYEYTLETMLAFKKAGVYPDMVQVGNEVSNGTLWPVGKLPDNWDNFASFIQAGINGVNASAGNQIAPRTMIHITSAGNWTFTEKYLDKIQEFEIDYDVVGMSWYPWNHGTLLDVKECLTNTANEFKKDIVIVETGYFWTAGRFEKKPAPFPETPEGQVQFLEELNRIILAVPENRGCGVMWWEPATGNHRLYKRGYFDSDGNALPVMNVFDKYTRD